MQVSLPKRPLPVAATAAAADDDDGHFVTHTSSYHVSRSSNQRTIFICMYICIFDCDASVTWYERSCPLPAAVLVSC